MIDSKFWIFIGYHTSQDATDVVKGLISSDGSYLHISSISQVLGDPAPGIIKHVLL